MNVPNPDSVSNEGGGDSNRQPTVDQAARRKANIRLAIILGIVAVLVYLGGFFFYLQ